MGAFAFAAAVSACGDKVTVPPPAATDSSIHSVNVSPPSVTMKIGDKVTLAASVDAGPGATDRTVKWSSSNTAVATVDANTGVVTAVSGGTATVIASANAAPSVQGAAAITVGALVNATIQIANVNQTTCSVFGNCSSVPANIAAILGQIDVTMNVDPGTQTVTGVDLIMNCTGTGNSGTDTVVASQNGGTDKAPIGGEQAATPVQLSFNTASFNATTGAVSFKNGNCTIKGRARTSSGTQSSSNTETLVLTNPDVIIGTMSSTKQASNPNTGLVWHGGDVTISQTPVFFTPGRSSASSIITYEGVNAPAGAGAQSVTFLDTNTPGSTNPLNIDNKTDANSDFTVQVVQVDNSGNNFQNPNGFGIVTAASYLANPAAGGVPPFCGAFCGGTNPFRLDTQKPISGGITLANNTDQGTGPNGFLNAAFRFAGDSAAGYRGADRLLLTGGSLTNTACLNAQTPNPAAGLGAATTISNCDFGGIDSVTVIFQTGTTSTGTFTTVANPANLAETATGTANLLRQITTDRLGNADTSWVCSGGNCPQWSGGNTTLALANAAKFGVDKTAPTATFVSGEAQGNTHQSAGSVGNYTLNITDPGAVGASGVGTYAGPGTVLVAQVRQWNAIGSTPGTENQNNSNNAFAARPGETVNTGPVAASNACTIGRFNKTQAKAGANALPIVNAAGTTIAFCTPTPYTPGGVPTASTFPADVNTLDGYYTTQIIAPDQAGNLSAPFKATILSDATAPVIQNVDVPPTIAGNSTAPLPANVTDTISASVGDIVASWPAVQYGATGIYQYSVTTGPGVAFDNVLTATTPISPSIPNFIKQLQVNSGAAPTTSPANSTNATDFIVVAQDAANNVGFKDILLSSQPTSFTGSATNWQGSPVANQFTGGFSISASAANVSNGPASVTPVNPTSTVITAVATGTTGSFTNPFVVTQLWYRPTGGLGIWFMAPASDAVASAPSTSDNGVNRTWNFAFTWNPPAQTPPSHLGGPQNLTPNPASISVDVVIIGISANGDAIQTPTQTITLTNP